MLSSLLMDLEILPSIPVLFIQERKVRHLFSMIEKAHGDGFFDVSVTVSQSVEVTRKVIPV